MKSIYIASAGILLLGNVNCAQAQLIEKKYVVADSIQIASYSINPIDFSVESSSGLMNIDEYEMNFETGWLVLKKTPTADSISVRHRKYPSFLTQTYRGLSSENILKNPEGYKVETFSKKPLDSSRLFEGLSSRGRLSRGLRIGNNQNAVFDSELNLQLSGNISENVSLTATITDANIPIQPSGYTQRLDAFDQVSIALESDKWKLLGGDLNLQNNESYFLSFTKKVRGVSLMATPNESTSLGVSLALVRGQFQTNQFNAKEGNQGPYKLTGPNNELFLLVVSGSERVYVNGRQLQRGENADYVMDYNAGELLFTPRFPITADMRIIVEYQYTENNYTRYVSYAHAKHQSKSFYLESYLYTEKDVKNSPLQLDLSSEQKQLLANAGDDTSKQQIDSGVMATFGQNKVLYKKVKLNGQLIYVYSNEENETLYKVQFQYVGAHQGNYVQGADLAAGRVFEYVPPVQGVPQGSFSPNVSLPTPKLLQTAVVKGGYQPHEKTEVSLEMSMSKNDLNLFSDLDDNNNKGTAGRLFWAQKILQKKSSLKSTFALDWVDQNYRNVEGLYQVEFNRDWSLETVHFTNQRLISTQLIWDIPNSGGLTYGFEKLNFQSSYEGMRHMLNGQFRLGSHLWEIEAKKLSHNGAISFGSFDRLKSVWTYRPNKFWTVMGAETEKRISRNKSDQILQNQSHRFFEGMAAMGLGDREENFVEIGFRFRENDSVAQKTLDARSVSKTFFLDSKPYQNENGSLRLYSQYRILKNPQTSLPEIHSFNAQIIHLQNFWNKQVQLNTTYENSAGNVAQQEWAFFEVEAGIGTHTWIDYNEDGEQTLDEFEVAQFQDEANYLQIQLPNKRYVPTQRTQLSHTINLNPSAEKGTFWSQFQNQTSFLIDRQTEREAQQLKLNPFDENDAQLIRMQKSIRNIFWFRKGNPHFSSSYTFQQNASKQLLWQGTVDNEQLQHEIHFRHQIHTLFNFELRASHNKTKQLHQQYKSRNYQLSQQTIVPKFTYWINDRTRLEGQYQWQNKNNMLGLFEKLEQHQLKAFFSQTNRAQYALTAALSWISNQFEGTPFSAVGYQMLEGLQAGTNWTWTLTAQKKLSNLLDLSLNYHGRKSSQRNVIHTGSVQLRAQF